MESILVRNERSLTESGRPTHHSSRRAAVRLARRFRGSLRATLCVAQPRAKGRTRLSGRPLGGYAPNVRRHKSARPARARARRLCHGSLATAHALRWGSCGGVHLCARAARRVQRSLQSTHERQPPRVALPGMHGSGSSRLHALRFCGVTRAAQPRAAQPAAGTAHLPKRSAAKHRVNAFGTAALSGVG
jgi:hypothetical protein